MGMRPGTGMFSWKSSPLITELKFSTNSVVSMETMIIQVSFLEK